MSGNHHDRLAYRSMMMSRRQNSSCDQCRKGKRACDAVWLRDRQNQRPLDANELKSPAGVDDAFDLVGPCTNCARTSKQCTFEWVQSQQLQRKEKQAPNLGANVPNAFANAGASRKAVVPGTDFQSASADAQSPAIPSNIPLRPLRPSIPTTTTTFDLQPSFPFAAHVPTDHQMMMGMEGCLYSPTSRGPGFEVSDPAAGVAFVDGSLTTTTGTPMGLPSGPVSRMGLDTSAAAAHCNSAPPSHGMIDYGLGPYCTGPAASTIAAPHQHPSNNNCFTDASVGLGVWPSPAMTTSEAVSSISSPVGVADDRNTPTQQQQQQQQQQRPQQTPSMRKRRRTQSPAPVQFGPSGARACMAVTTTSSPTPAWTIMQAWTESNRICRTTNGNMIGETMMRIYHDVMEGALSCWLTEQTCPYNSLPAATMGDGSGNTSTNTTGHHQQQQQQQQQQQFWGTLEDMQREWGPNWSNRIYRRVMKLDRMSHLLGLKKLSTADERKVSSALNAAVMAFTAQWAQSSHRSSARWPSAPSNDLNGGHHQFRPPELDLDINMGEEFDRTLQKSLWNQARKALYDCSEIDSFRIVFAEIIFGLTQRYGEDREDDDVSSGGDDHDSQGGNTSAVVEDILREDTQQIWLERATRRLHVLRRRVELYDRQMRNEKGIGRDGKTKTSHSYYDAECRKTMDLLFWLAVMFDTISSAMTERPLTVSDDDSSNLALTHPTTATSSSALSSSSSQLALAGPKRWNVILSKDQQTKITSLRWPCTDQDIAQELADAAPVKVLLYRKVTRLQALLARAPAVDDGAAAEEAIEDALMVYGHWQTLYNPLFGDCIAHHGLLSARIQSWYVCLLGHWLLATLLLVDLVEMMARGGRAGTTAAIRSASVGMIADLARASTPRHDDEAYGGQLANFHHAVNEGALLTEPWTMILIRAFSRAAIILLEHEVDNLPGEQDRGSLARCEDCVKALWYLGRKSDMARKVAQVLAVALQRARFKVGPISSD